jgi:hypothetical protein
MKFKMLIASLLVAVSSIASAVELGLVTTYNNTSDTIGQGITLGQKFDKFGVQYGLFNSVNTTGKWQHKQSLTGSYDFYTFKSMTFNVKAGTAYINKQDSTTGWTSVSGLGASYPLTPSTRITADYIRQQSFDKNSEMASFNANIFQAGIKVSF